MFELCFSDLHPIFSCAGRKVVDSEGTWGKAGSREGLRRNGGGKDCRNSDWTEIFK